MFKKLFKRKPNTVEIRRYVEMEYVPEERDAAFHQLMHDATR